MGRQQYLERLALGRSAFEDVIEHIPSSQILQETAVERTEDEASGAYVQRYDDKGRPINPAIDQFNHDLREAQNEALELVGVVEKKDQSDFKIEQVQNFIRERRSILLAAEHDRGELLDFVLTPIRFLSRVWAEAFVHRVQIGLYHPSYSMTAILLSEWRSRGIDGFRMSLATRFPAMVDILAHALIRIPLTVGVEQITGRLQTIVQKQHLPRKTIAHLYQAISLVFDMLVLGIDIALLPIEYYAFAQRMALAPALPLFPPWKFCIPGTSGSFHSFGWKPLACYVLIRTLSSPAFLLLAYKQFRYDEEEDESPIWSLFTYYRYPKINAYPEKGRPEFLPRNPKTDPFGYILQTGYNIRTAVLKFCGWNIVKEPNSYRSSEYEHNTIAPIRHPLLQGRYGPRPIYRSTHLAHMPAEHLARAIDKLYSHIITLPFESLMLRSIAATYMSSSSSLPKTPQAIQAASRLYTPFGGGPLATAFRSSDWSSLGQYVSRLGLAMALSASIDALLAFGVYSATRHVGVTFFDWGRKDYIGIEGILVDDSNSHTQDGVTIEDVHDDP